MKRLMLLFFFSGSISFLSAQSHATKPLTALKAKDRRSAIDGYIPATLAPYNTTTAHYLRSQHRPAQGASSRAVTYDTLGRSGNVYTILDAQVNRVAANQDINSVAFIHRANPNASNNFNVAQFVYDVSTNGGNTFTNNIGPVNPNAENVFISGRYPNATLYNPTGNITASNAYLGYVGAWLPYNNSTTSTTNWKGFYAGVAQLNNNPSTFTSNVTRFNNSNVLIAKGLCNGKDGEFWSADFAYDAVNTDVTGVLLYKGVWNPTTKDIVWNLHKKFTPTFERGFDQKAHATSVNVSFDPTGRYGWLVFLGDIDQSATAPKHYTPIFYNTTDGGASWSGPVAIDLASLPNIASSIDTLTPTTGFDLDLAVDYKGNPHGLAIVSATSGDYTILTGGNSRMHMFDFTLNDKKEWSAILMDTVLTFRGDITSALTEENRPQVSSSPNGKLITFGWLDSDPNANSGQNNVPDLFTRTYNAETGLADNTINHTGGDPNFNQQALFASFAPTSFLNGTTLTIPTVIAQLNLLTISDEDSANFYYLKNITHNTADLIQDVTAPTITLAGCNPYTVTVNGTYTEPGATAIDNKDGSLTSSIQTTGTVNTAVAGTYTKTYTVTDAAGNTYTTTRTVKVVTTANGAAPVITLVGANTITVNKCSTFSDPGATAADQVDGDISSNITSNASAVNTAIPGTYTITYNVNSCSSGLSATVNRTVIVSNSSIVITLAGDATDSIQPCSSYADLGAQAYDLCAGPIGVTVSTLLDTSLTGSYVINYIATNGTESDTVRRTVVVERDTTAPSLSLAIGSNTVYVYLGTVYNDTLPNASDCSGIASLTSDQATSVNTTSRGNYTVTYTARDGNGNTGTITRNVVVGTEPDPNFGVTFPTNTLVKFSDSSLYNPTGWQWDFGDNQGSILQNPSHPYITVGEYTVCLTAKNVFNSAPFSKTPKQTCKTITYTGIEDLAIENSFSVIPNPTTGQVTLNMDAAGFAKLDVSVVNMIGETLNTLNLTQVPAKGSYTFDLSNYAKGVYFLKIQTDKGTATKKVTLIK